MATTTLKKAASTLAKDVAAANALRSAWNKRPDTQRSSRTKASASASDTDDDGACSCDDCEAQPAQPGEPSALTNTAWLDDLAETLRSRARELDEFVAAQSEDSEWNEAYRRLAHALRVDAVMAQRQRECEWDVMRDAVNRAHAARPGFALVG